MSSLALSALLELVDRSEHATDAEPTKRAQGRPARGENEVGVRKIVEGMRAALRALQSTKVTRKDVAGHAGVTPALVTYYFPERNDLIEAATLPVVSTLLDSVRSCLEHDGPARERLRQATEALLDAYTRDAPVIDLYSHHRASTSDSSLPDLLSDLDSVVESFFEAWLLDHPGHVYDAAFLRKAMVGACRTLARRGIEAAVLDTTDHHRRQGYADMVCSMVLGPASSKPTEAAALADGGGSVF